MRLGLLILLISLTVSLAQSPAPAPVPLASLDLDRVQGLWYEVMMYPMGDFHDTSCSTWNVTISQPNVNVDVNTTVFGRSGNYTLNLYLTGNSTWSAPLFVFDWVAIDPNYQWGTVATTVFQFGVVLSRTPTLDQSIIQSQVKLLAQQGFLINSTNYVTPTNCTQLEETIEIL